MGERFVDLRLNLLFTLRTRFPVSAHRNRPVVLLECQMNDSATAQLSYLDLLDPLSDLLHLGQRESRVMQRGQRIHKGPRLPRQRLLYSQLTAIWLSLLVSPISTKQSCQRCAVYRN